MKHCDNVKNYFLKQKIFFYHSSISLFLVTLLLYIISHPEVTFSNVKHKYHIERSHFINTINYKKSYKHLLLQFYFQENGIIKRLMLKIHQSEFYILFTTNNNVYFSYKKKNKRYDSSNAFIKHHQLLKKTNETKYCEKSSQDSKEKIEDAQK